MYTYLVNVLEILKFISFSDSQIKLASLISLIIKLINFMASSIPLENSPKMHPYRIVEPGLVWVGHT